MKKIVFRVDSGNHIGIGHVSRALTLARELSKTIPDISFITKNHNGASIEAMVPFKIFVIPGGVEKELSDSERDNYEKWLGSTQEEDLKETNKILSELGEVDLVILDNYSLDAFYEKNLLAKKIIVIDDLYNRRHACHLLLNQNITSSEGDYQKLSDLPGTKYLLGPAYALLREEFRELRKDIDPLSFKRATKRILVFFGGKDVGGDTLRLAECLSVNSFEKYSFLLMMDMSHDDYHKVIKLVESCQNVMVQGLSKGFAELMKRTDLFIGAGGSTAWERATLGIASAIVCTADNQKLNCKALSETKNAYYLGTSKEMTPVAWESFFKNTVSDEKLWEHIRLSSFELVDALGAKKVAQAIKELINE